MLITIECDKDVEFAAKFFTTLLKVVNKISFLVPDDHYTLALSPIFQEDDRCMALLNALDQHAFEHKVTSALQHGHVLAVSYYDKLRVRYPMATFAFCVSSDELTRTKFERFVMRNGIPHEIFIPDDYVTIYQMLDIAMQFMPADEEQLFTFEEIPISCRSEDCS